eukprot:CAMPEP_0119323302 /NCGR_PEP_ID=MMETSP1333-20130426/60422_1 /TAXON_ID=418940 /ORGANISM="Scyphosphaera apsteinii, Strain RCC1455" /LENGTH=263 /DNA_ID=CAMNT_0007330707 /DNA_START=154 /DNA_END=945 /DNA_ORIENTATION=+
MVNAVPHPLALLHARTAATKNFTGIGGSVPAQSVSTSSGIGLSASGIVGSGGKNVNDNNQHKTLSDTLRSSSGGPDLTITHRVFIDIALDEPGKGAVHIGRVVFGLYGKEMPKTVENFRSLCTGEMGLGKSGVPLSYKGSLFHRIVPHFMIQGGDITRGDGRGGESIFGPHFNDEGFTIRHGSAGALAMANSGPDTNNSQFYVTLTETPWLDGKHVVFGRMVSGQEVIKRIEASGSSSGQPKQRMIVSAAGELRPEKSAARVT